MYLTGVIGIEILKVQLLARWASPIITHYTRLAPLRSLATDMKGRIAKRNLDNKCSSNEQAILKLKNSVETHMSKVQEEIHRLDEMIKKSETSGKPKRYLKNRKNCVLHYILAGYEDVGPGAITHCGWKYAFAKVEVALHGPRFKQEACDTCMAELRRSLPERPGPQ